MGKVERAIYFVGAGLAILAIGFTIFILFKPLLFSGSRNRLLKDFGADVNGGLKRVVTVYSFSGTPIRSWQGRIDLSSSDNEVNMIVDSEKRVIIQGGVVVVEEQ